MVAFNVAQDNLITEIEAAMAAITPVTMATKGFRRIKHSTKDLGAITESFIGNRAYDIASGRMINPREMGKAYKFPVYEYDITVQYRVVEKWSRAAHSDIQLIRDKLFNTISVSGVQGSWFKPDISVELQLHDSNDFQFFIMPLYVEYSTDDIA